MIGDGKGVLFSTIEQGRAKSAHGRKKENTSIVTRTKPENENNPREQKHMTRKIFASLAAAV